MHHQQNGQESAQNRMEAALISDDAPTSFAKECICLCSAESRTMDVNTHKKNKKREERKKVLERFYHYHEYDPSQEVQIEKEAKGFDKGTKTGIMSHYNFRFDCRIGTGKCAARRIPCLCTSCKEQLQKPWNQLLPACKQDMFAENKSCKFWDLFQGLNNWRILDLVDKVGADNADDEFKEQIIRNYISIMEEKIKDGDVGAVSTSDNNTDGYYLVKWCSDPYTLQEDIMNTTFTDYEVIEIGDMVCDGLYYNPLPYDDMKHWYELSSHEALIPLQQVLHTGIKMESLSDANKPSKSGKKFIRCLKRKKVVKINESDIDEIFEEMERREDINVDA